MGNEILKAGGIILKREGDRYYILLIYRDKQKDWSFPKGHIELGEDAKNTALREVEEETGLKTEIIKELPPNRYLNTRTGKNTITLMYLLKPLSGNLKVEHKNDRLEWFKVKEVAERLSYNNLKNYFLTIINDLI